MTNAEAKKNAKYFMDNVGFDYILETFEGPNFLEYVVRYGGDTLTYRVYNYGDEFIITEG